MKRDMLGLGEREREREKQVDREIKNGGRYREIFKIERVSWFLQEGVSSPRPLHMAKTTT